MSNRKRVNISIDPDTYSRMRRMQSLCGFKNSCEMIVALLHVMLDRLEGEEDRKLDIPDEDAAYIDEMFDSLSMFEPTPATVSPSKIRRERRTDG